MASVPRWRWQVDARRSGVSRSAFVCVYNAVDEPSRAGECLAASARLHLRAKLRWAALPGVDPPQRPSEP
jgi:hypothetical protein